MLCLKERWILSSPRAPIEEAQADLSLQWAHMSTYTLHFISDLLTNIVSDISRGKSNGYLS